MKAIVTVLSLEELKSDIVINNTVFGVFGDFSETDLKILQIINEIKKHYGTS